MKKLYIINLFRVGVFFRRIFTAPDLLTVSKISGKNYDKNMCTYYLEPEVSPHLAAEIENKKIEPEKIISEIENRKKEADYLIVEGAGGIICTSYER